MITYGSTTLTSYNSIVKTEVYYYKSTSATSLSGGSWATTKPTWENGKYIWQKIRTIYEDGTHTESDPVNITGQQGATGTAAYSYKLNSSDSIIGKTKDGEYTIKKITFSATYKQGTGAISAYSGRFKIESTTNGSTWKTEYTSSGNEASKEFTIPDDIIAIRCLLYQSDGTTVLLDIVTVPVVKDGVDAIGLRDSIPYYLASDKDTGITRLTQGWTRYRPQLTAEKKYLWVYYVSRYSEGTTEPELIEIKDDLVHFVNNGDESPVESCVVDIDPVQEGSGDPSPDNVRPITGWTGCEVQRTGKNLLFNTVNSISTNGITFTVNEDRSITVNGTATARANLYYSGALYIPPADYYLSIGKTFATGQCYFEIVLYNAATKSKRYINTNGRSGYPFTVEKGDYIQQIYFSVFEGKTVNDTIYPQIKLGSTATDYEPYSGQTYSITFPSQAGTVYGGTLDVTKGELVVDRAIWTGNTADMNNSENYPGWWNAGIKDIVGSGVNKVDNAISNVSPTLTSGRYAIGVNTTSSSHTGTLWLSKNYFNKNQTEWKALALDIQVVLPLATPVTYTLTPQEITSLFGTNNLWADTGDISISYYDDQKTTEPIIDQSLTSVIEMTQDVASKVMATYGESSSSAGDMIKVVDCENFELYEGARLQIAFENSNTVLDQLFLDVNNTGSKAIYVQNEPVSNTNQLIWGADTLMEFVYTNDGWHLQNAPFSLFGLSDTSANQANKMVNCEHCVICKGTSLSVNMNHTNTVANATLNIDSTIPILIHANGQPLTTNSRFNWRANTTQKFVFDGQVWRMDDDSVKALATAYITEIDDDGIMVHPEDDSTSGWAISDAIQLFKNGISYIKLWIENNIPKIRIGKEDQGHIILDNDSVDIRNDDKVLASFGATSVIGDENDWHQTIAANQITFAKGDNTITYISPDKLYTINAEVADAFYISNYSIRNASDGKLVIGLRR